MDFVLLSVWALLPRVGLIGLCDLQQILLQSLPIFDRVAERTEECGLETADWMSRREQIITDFRLLYDRVFGIR